MKKTVIFGAFCILSNPVFSHSNTIPHPGPYSGVGQEAGRSVEIQGDYSLLGAYRDATDLGSGSAYIFENGRKAPVQRFTLNELVHLNLQDVTVDNSGVVIGEKRRCSSYTHRAELGRTVSMSDQWVALSANRLGGTALLNSDGFTATPGSETSECGKNPTVFLARKQQGKPSFDAIKPFTDLNYSIRVPNGEIALGLSVSNTDLAIMSASGVHLYAWNEGTDNWDYDETLKSDIDFTESGNFENAPVSMAGDLLVFSKANNNTGDVYFYARSNGQWNVIASGSGGGYGFDVDTDGHQFAVSWVRGAIVYQYVNGSFSLSGYDAQLFSSAQTASVAISGDTVIASTGYETPSDGYPVKLMKKNTSTGVWAFYSNIVADDWDGQAWRSLEVDIDGNSYVAGNHGLDTQAHDIVGGMIFGRIENPFNESADVVDNAESSRIWVNAGDYSWHRQSGPTETANAGPDSAFGSVGSYYYVESSRLPNGAYDVGSEAYLVSDTFVLPNKKLTFDYLNYGADGGVVFVEYLKTNGEWEIRQATSETSIDGSDWKTLFINWGQQGFASNFTSKIRLRYESQTGGEKIDFAIDNIRLYE